MTHRIVTVQFSRDGLREGFPLDPSKPYRARIDGGPLGEFQTPWDQHTLEDHIETLRNTGEQTPTARVMKDLGMELGRALYAIPGMESALTRRNGDEQIIVYWQLDYPELARVPWELATTNQPPYPHLLERGISFVRKVPTLLEDVPAQWPTGLNKSLRLLFVWGEDKPEDVPHKQHLAELQAVCAEYGVDFVAQEIPDVATLTGLCSDLDKQFHFVHILAHGARADGNWGLRLKSAVALPEQIAKALRAGGQTPAIVTLSACDSANDKDNSFGSVAYELHAHGIPLVVASQFRLRKDVSVMSVGEGYRELLGGADLRDMMTSVRRKLAPNDNEAWANEVVYTRYRYESLDELAVVARQQAALRRANAIERKARKAKEADKIALIRQLEEETGKLRDLIDRLTVAGAGPAAFAETWGLLGSMQRRKARLRSDPPDEEDLRDACLYYEEGMRADANSHYCGVNVVHLSLRLDDQDKADEFIPLVRFAAESRIKCDFWALATAGELEVYAGDGRKAADHYREFARKVIKEVDGKDAIVEALNSAKRQIDEIVTVFADREPICRAAEASCKVLIAAIRRNGSDVEEEE